jgi:PAS domain S-box-containing protein
MPLTGGPAGIKGIVGRPGNFHRPELLLWTALLTVSLCLCAALSLLPHRLILAQLLIAIALAGTLTIIHLLRNLRRHARTTAAALERETSRANAAEALLQAESQARQQALQAQKDAAEAALRAGEASEAELHQFRRAAELSTDTIVITDLRGNIQYVNARFQELTGYTPEEMLGQNTRMLQSGLHTRSFYQALWDTILAGNIWKGEFCNKRKDGELYWEKALIAPVQDAHGDTTHFVAIKTDITAHKQAADELARTEEALRQREALLLTMTGAAPLAFYVVDDRSGAVLHFNQRFCDLWNLNHWREDLRHGEKQHSDVFPQWIELAADKLAMAQTCQRLRAETERATVENDVALADGRTIRHFSTQIRDQNDRYFGRLHLFEDITARKQAERQIAGSLKEKEILLREVYHRVKNNLQVISSLLNLQSGSITDPQTLRLLRETQDRVRSMALVHEKLYRAEDLSRIDFSEYTRHLATMLTRSYRTQAGDIQLEFDLEKLRLNLDTAIPCGLILNELISNALKYAFPPQRSNPRPARLMVSLHATDPGTYTLQVADSGVGLPEGIDIHKTSSLGLQVVSLLSEQLGGSASAHNSDGACFTIRFRELQYKDRT